MSAITIPKLAVATADEAMQMVNQWLHREVGMFLQATTAQYDERTGYWRLPVELAYAYDSIGVLGIIGDVYLNALTGEFAGQLRPEELAHRAEQLAAKYGIE